MIEQDIARIEVLRKKNDWTYEEFSLGDAITLEAIDLTLTVDAIYDRVDSKEINAFRQKTWP